MPKKLYRSDENKYLSGVCGGLGEYFEIDPTLVRLIMVLLTLATGGAVILAYILAWIIVPARPAGASEPSEPIRYPSWSKYLPGLLLIIVGALMLMREFWFWFSWHEMWPVILILFGLFLVFRHNSNSRHARQADNLSGNRVNPDNGGNAS